MEQPATRDEELLAAESPAVATTHSEEERLARIREELDRGFGALKGLGKAVSVFGSARTHDGDPDYELARRTTRLLGEAGFAVITGGGPGTMEAANRGAREAGARSVGLNIELPFEQEVNPFVSQAYGHRTFFSRLHHFMILSDAFVVVPGGIGTLLEMSLVWQLLQVRKLYNTPLILVGKMWPELVEWGRRSMLHEGSELASEVDFRIPHCVNTIEETVALIRKNRAAWLAGQTPK